MTTPPPRPARIQPARIQFTGSTAGPSAPPPDDGQSDLSANVTAATLSALIPEWQLTLRAENKAPGTTAVSDAAQRHLA